VHPSIPRVGPRFGLVSCTLLLGGSLVLGAIGCGNDAGDPGPSWGGFQETIVTLSPPHVALILVVDDRATARAATLRAGTGAAMRQLVVDADRASWRPIEFDVIIVPASAASTDAAVGPSSDARLTWRTKQATLEDGNALAAVVEERVRTFSAAPGAPFQPLARGHELVELVAQLRPPASDAEAGLVAAVSPHRWIGVSVVASSDDESPEPPTSYRLPTAFGTAGFATNEQDGSGASDPGLYPRLTAWTMERPGSPVAGCGEDLHPPFSLFRRECLGEITPRCGNYAIDQISPGLGRCDIRITTPEPLECDATRGWADPLGQDGVRRPQTTSNGERSCDLLPVDPSVMDACIHDEACTDCGGGWCVTEVLPDYPCRAGTTLLPLRWVGGALPTPGSVRLTCLRGAR